MVGVLIESIDDSSTKSNLKLSYRRWLRWLSSLAGRVGGDQGSLLSVRFSGNEKKLPRARELISDRIEAIHSPIDVCRFTLRSTTTMRRVTVRKLHCDSHWEPCGLASWASWAELSSWHGSSKIRKCSGQWSQNLCRMMANLITRSNQPTELVAHRILMVPVAYFLFRSSIQTFM